MNPLLLDSATELARKIRQREVTSRQVVDAHIARIEAVNPTLNAVVVDRFAAARAEADAADALQAKGGALPPFHGVPCTIKESFAVTGMPNTSGLVARVGLQVSEDAVTVKRLRDAGFIVMGVTNLSELCMWMESNNAVYGRTSNPYDATRIAGGSSGGEGSIVGSGGSPFGLGADVGGSIRMPAFFNGVFGHKPGSGIVPNTGQFPTSEGQASLMLGTGPIARRAVDLMPLLRILAGPDGVDEVCVAAPLGDPDRVSLKGLRVTVVPDDARHTVDPGLAASQQKVANWLRDQGADVRELRLPELRRAFDIWSAKMGEHGGAGKFRKLMQRPQKRQLLRHLLHSSAFGGPHTLPATILGLVEDVGEWAPSRTKLALSQGRELRETLLDLIGEGVLLYPPYPVPAPRHNEPLRRPFAWVYTALFNAMGFPVTQVPTGLNQQGLPLGVQIVAAPGHDHVTIAVAVALEKAGVAGWVPPAT